MVYLILTNKFLLKTNQIKNILLIISAQENKKIPILFPNKTEIYRIGQNDLKISAYQISAKIQYRHPSLSIIFKT